MDKLKHPMGAILATNHLVKMIAIRSVAGTANRSIKPNALIQLVLRMKKIPHKYVKRLLHTGPMCLHRNSTLITFWSTVSGKRQIGGDGSL